MSIVPVYAEPEEIVALIRDASKKPGKDYVIVDVRGDDYNVITENCTEIYCIC
jgi:Cdc25 family phosphatase